MILVGVFQFGILLVALARGKGLALILGPEGVGVVGTIDQLVVALYQISALGLPFTAMKFMSAAHSRSKGAYLRSFAAFSRIILALSLIVAALAVFGAIIRPTMFGTEFEHYPDVLPVALAGLPILAVTVLLSRTLAAAKRSWAAALFGLVSAAGLMIGGLTGALADGLRGFYIGHFTLGIIVSIGVLVWLRRTTGLSVLRRNVSVVRELTVRPAVIRVAVSAYLILVGYSVCLLVVRYLVLQQLGEAAAGLLQAALAISLSAGSILMAMNSLHLSPNLNREIPVEAKLEKAHVFARRIVVYFIAGGIPVALFPETVLTVLYSREFIPAAGLLLMCLVWQILYQVMLVYQQLLMGADKPVAQAVLTGAGFVLSAALAILLTERIGIFAAPISLIGGATLSLICMLVWLSRTVNMRPPWSVLGLVLLPIAVIAAAGFLLDPATELTIAGGALRLAVTGVCIIAAWLLLSRNERESLLELLPRMTSR